MIKGISCILHQAKNSRNPGSSRISVGRKLMKLNLGTPFLSPPRRSISLQSSNVCPLAAMLANIFLNPSLQDTASAEFQSSRSKQRYYLKLSNPVSISRFPCLLLSFPNPRLSVISEIVSFDHMEDIEDGSYNHWNQRS